MDEKLVKRINDAAVAIRAGLHVSGSVLRKLVVALDESSALEDARRLDWLDKTRGDEIQRDPRTGEPELVAHYWAVQGQCYDVREAIDSQRAAIDAAIAEGEG